MRKSSINMSNRPEGYFSYKRTEMLRYVPISAHTILDVGCGDGSFGMEVKNQFRAEVWGIEINKAVASVAAKRLDKVLDGDVSTVIRQLPNSYFDCIFFNDTLEHLADPYGVLRSIKHNLRYGGIVVCSLPNIRYFFVLYNLLVKKQWIYQDAGVLDKAHLRFFTRNSIIDMFRALDYQVLKIEGINPITSWKYHVLNIASFGYLSDTRYLQFACVAKPK